MDRSSVEASPNWSLLSYEYRLLLIYYQLVLKTPIRITVGIVESVSSVEYMFILPGVLGNPRIQFNVSEVEIAQRYMT